VTSLPVLLAIGVIVGAVNALAGGGTFLLFPALLFLGHLAPVTANATASLIVLPGTMMSAFVYRSTMRNFEPRMIGLLALTSLAGSVVGSILLLVTPNTTFSGLVPWLLLGGALVFTAAPWIRKRAGRMTGHRSTVALALGQFAIGFYGGYFGAGMGVLLMALYLMAADLGPHEASGMRMFSAGVINLIAVALFAARGALDYSIGGPMLLATVAGGYLGAKLIQKLDADKVRLGVLIYAWALTAWFFARMIPSFAS
jgi:uncharacterized membrane protein YfcA